MTDPKPKRATTRKRGSAAAAGGGKKQNSTPAPRVEAGKRDNEEKGEQRGAVFPIVGLGASAGGLEALQGFLAHVPANSGMAFVVVQHLDPTRQGLLVELLQHSTKMPVRQTTDQMRVVPNHVYVIPPNKDLSLLRGTLHLLPQTSLRGLNLPIDFFFRSLAEDQHERAIGVILSGMGSDGTLGLRAIKEQAGAAFVQSLTSAKFDGMPRSAIDAGLADVIAPVEELAARVMAYRQRLPHSTQPQGELEEKAHGALSKVCILLRSHTGSDFSLYKQSTIYRRIERRMGLHQIDTLEHYVNYLRENPREIDLLFKELLIGVTSFFRDPALWEPLKNEVLPALLAQRASGGTLRAWVPACSTGEEAYSLAMIFSEVLEPFKMVKDVAFQIFATDIDRDAVEKAREGRYPANIVADVSPERLRRFFVQEERGGYRIGKEIREKVVFAPQNVIMDPPFTKLDVISCRNLLIYFSSDLQKKLIPLFHYSLNPGGVLFLGSAETIGSFTSLFSPLDGKSRLYRRLEPSMMGVPVEFPVTVPSGLTSRLDERAREVPLNLQALADRVLVQRFSPVDILCNEKGDILYISGRAGKYLELAVGKANLQLFAMAREGLRHAMSSAFSTALRTASVVTSRHLKVDTDGGPLFVDLTVQQLSAPKELRGTVLVTLTDVAAPPKPKRPGRSADEPRNSGLERELLQAREEHQTTREEMQTSQEELKSTNEELQSTNEEMQSTNEELTTAKEEMQSLNEELQTVNHELQAKVDELSRSNNDMKNLLNSTDIATLFLDGDLKVRRFTTPTSKIIKLIAGDAGRPITDIASELVYPDLAEDAHEVLRTLVYKEKQVATRNERSFVVRIMPYRTLENVIDGVVITFTDVSASQASENALREQANQLRQMSESLSHMTWGCRPDGACDFLSRQWVEYTGRSDTEQFGYHWLDQVHPEDRERVGEEWRAAVKSGRSFDAVLRIRNAAGTYRWFKTRSAPIFSSAGAIMKWYGTHTDINELKTGEMAQPSGLRALRGALEHLNLKEGLVGLDSNLAVTFINSTAERMLSCKRAAVTGRKWQDVFAGASELVEGLRRALEQKEPQTFEAWLPSSSPALRASVSVVAGPEGLAILLAPMETRQ
jgi:two-component system CheB/CheR fusion protein